MGHPIASFLCPQMFCEEWNALSTVELVGAVEDLMSDPV
jgi:hypothetical protein